MANARHFLTVFDLTTEEILEVIRLAMATKRQGPDPSAARGKVLGLLFEKPSTRTRVSFEAAMFSLGGQVTFLSSRDLQLRRGEPLRDTARVLSRYLDCLAVRTFGQEVVEELARWSSIPVINGLTDQHHPCQGLSDIMTVMEKKGEDLSSLKVAWVGDGNNVANSWIQAASRLGIHLVLGCPAGYEPDPSILEPAREAAPRPIEVTNDPVETVAGADVVNTDVWASMGQEEEAEERKKVFLPFQLNSSLLSHAKDDAIVLHCLPAHRGEEITDEVLEGPQSVVWDQAENKMHLQRAMIQWLLQRSV